MSLSGLNIVLTGTMSRPRSEIQYAISIDGGTVQGGVSTSTDYLVVGRLPGGNETVKLAAARRRGIPYITETELYAMMGAQGRSGRIILQPSTQSGDRYEYTFSDLPGNYSSSMTMPMPTGISTSEPEPNTLDEQTVPEESPIMNIEPTRKRLHLYDFFD